MNAPGDHALAGRRILVVEDEFLIASSLADLLHARGVEVVGPSRTVDAALRLIEGSDDLDGALLDVNLRGVPSFGVADVLLERGVPFAFATGYDRDAIPPRFAKVPCHQKPFDARKVLEDLLG